MKLKIAMAREIHKDLENTFPFFQKQPETQFLSWVGHKLTPRIIMAEQYLYQETDPMLEMFFCLHGKAAYVLPRWNNSKYFDIIKGDIFGLEDAIYTLSTEAQSAFDVRMMTKKQFYGDRRFAVMVAQETMFETLSLKVTDLQKIALEFPRTIEYLYEDQSEHLRGVLVARLSRMEELKNSDIKQDDSQQLEGSGDKKLSQTKDKGPKFNRTHTIAGS